MPRSGCCVPLLVAGAVLATASSASAEPAVGVLAGAGNSLVTFDTAGPVTSVTRTVRGLRPNERLVGIDYRYAPADPAVPELYGVAATDGGATDDLRVYVIDPATGAATAVPGGPGTFAHGSAYGIAFNHAVDRIRVVNDAEESGRLNPFTGARVDDPGNDADLTPAADITAIAYDRVDADPATPTTLYGLSRATASLVRIGGPDGLPSANLGAVTTVGPLGLGTPVDLAFDIAPSGIAYAGLDRTLARVDLATGTATPIGAVPGPLRALAILPASTMTIDPRSATRAESAGPATFTVTRGGDSRYFAQVDYAASDGSAAGRLLFAPGETERTFLAPVADDKLDAPDRVVVYMLRSADGLSAVGQPATLTIADDDPPADRTPPKTTLKVAPATTRSSFVSKGVKITATTSEAAKLELSLEATPKGAVLSAAYGLTLAAKSLNTPAGKRVVALKPAKKLVGKPKRSFKVRVRVIATDAAGNRSTTTKVITVKR